MKQADLILRNAKVLTMDEDFTIYNPGAVVVNNDCFLDVGLESDIVENYQAAEVINFEGKHYRKDIPRLNLQI